MNYYEQNDRRGRIWGAIFVVLYTAVCVGVMFLSYTISLPEPAIGILVDLGSGGGDTGGAPDESGANSDPALSERDAVPSTTPPAPVEELLTTDEEDAPEIAPEPRPTEPPAPRQVVEPTPTPTSEPAREVNQRALFPGRTAGSTSSSQGADTGAGNQGSPGGGQGGSAGGSGSAGFSLSGRYLIGNLPRPAYSADAEGRVVIRITVNAAGNVTSAVYEAAGSTTNHGELVSAARTAASKARFTAGTEDIQTGTITYIFRLQ